MPLTLLTICLACLLMGEAYHNAHYRYSKHIAHELNQIFCCGIDHRSYHLFEITGTTISIRQSYCKVLCICQELHQYLYSLTKVKRQASNEDVKSQLERAYIVYGGTECTLTKFDEPGIVRTRVLTSVCLDWVCTLCLYVMELGWRRLVQFKCVIT